VKWFILFVGVIVVCFVVALILGLVGGAMSRPTSSLSHEPLPDEPIDDADFDDLVFDVGVRGYRMSQVDGVVDRLRRELREKNAEIAVLRGLPPEVETPEETAAEAPVVGKAELEAPEPETPEPETPEPETPEPATPEPETPKPGAAEPEVPEPEARRERTT